MALWYINMTYNSRNLDSFEVQAENESEAIVRAREQLEESLAVDATAMDDES